MNELTSIEVNRMIQTLGEDSSKDKYYVYALCLRDNTPFYIGKGQGRRVLDHFENALDAQRYIEADESLTEAERQIRVAALSRKLQTLLKAGVEYNPVIVKWGLTEHEAFMCESALINMHEFCCGGQGGNALTNIVNGHASKREKASVADVKTKARTVGQFMVDCAIGEKSADGVKAGIVFIKINDFYPRCLNEDGMPDQGKIREAARGIWRIHPSRRNRIDYLFALYHGRVVGIFHVVGVSRSAHEECRDGALGYPTFPNCVREAERSMLRYDTLSDARASLSSDEWGKVDAFLQGIVERKPDRTKEGVFEDLKERVYLNVDDEVEPQIRAFMNTIVTIDGSRAKLSGQNPVVYNF